VSWSGRTRGGYLGNWWFVTLIRVAGLRVAYALLVLVAGYFVVASPRSFRVSVDYLQRVLGPRHRWRWPALVYRHYFSYGVTLLDRIAVILGRAQMECSYEGEGLFREYLDRGQGIILLGAHVGNWEMGGHLLGRHGIPVNFVVVEREVENVRRLFDQAGEGRRFRVLTADDDPLRVVPILAALRRGEMVALHGDRSVGGAEVCVRFLGGQARFPVGPYQLAAASGAPIFQVFSMRERLRRYRFFTFPAQFVDRQLLRQETERLKPYVAEYAERLENVLRQYPFQWGNFHAFWETHATGESGSDGLGQGTAAG
jgi:predicted LPLAT superfamily acyltransferase